ncbi:MAG: electron transport complex subunit RsxC [Lachnospiraceae bacterium]|nr:electron transport complex subunit RsxC [Lachnospiraceae bacterium]
MMTLKTFIGGINPRNNKEMAKTTPIEIVLPGKELVYPLAGKYGTPAKAIVKVGDKVFAGQKIGRADGFFSVPVHASVSGIVRGIKKRAIFTGEQVKSIIIENDGLYDEIDYPSPIPLAEMANPDIINRIQDAGIIGMSGSGHPTHIKLSPQNPDKISHIIINGAECEPYITNDHHLMLSEPDRLIGGLKVLLKLFPYARGVIAIADDKTDCIDLLREKTVKEARISIKILKNKYPQGSGRQLISAVTGRFTSTAITAEAVGVILLNIDTVINIQRTVLTNKNLTSRIVTVAGNAIKGPRSFCVRLGTSYDTLIEAAGGYIKKPEQIISGGPMMGNALKETDIPVTKLSTAILLLTKDEVLKSNQTACINCLKCVSVCPERLLPQQLAVFAKHDDKASFIKHAGKECLECGCCSYICPAKLDLTEAIKSMKLPLMS